MIQQTQTVSSTSARNRLSSWISEHPASVDAVALIAFYAIFVAVKFWWVARADGPVVFRDEYLYKAAAESLAAGRGLVVDGSPLHGYPPLYSIVLAPAFVLGGDWYAWLLRINALLSSLVVFPVWWIARRFLSRPESWAVVLLASVTPYNSVTPRLVMSENLFIPLVLVAFATVLVDTYRPTALQCLATGAVWALAELTRYVFLPAIPVLAVLWFVQPWFVHRTRLADLFRGRAHLAALVLAGVAIVYAPWVAYTLSQNIQPAASFGLAGARAALQAPVIASHTLVADLVFWSTVCLAYLLIGSAPYLPVLMAFPFARVRAGDRRENFFAIALVLLAATFTATAIYYLSRLHADRSYIEGRYLMYLFPLLPVAAFLSVRRLRTLSTRMRVTLTWIALGASLVLLYGSYRMLISGSPLNLNPTFVNIAWVSPDVIAFTTNTLPLFGTLMRLLIFLLIVGAAIYTLAPRQTALVVTAVVVVAFLAGTGYLASRVEAGQAEAVHGKELAAEVEQVLARGGTAPVPIAVDKDVPIDQMTMISSLEFWQVPADAFSYSIVPSGQLDDSVFASEIVLTSAKYGDPAVSYQVGTTTYGIYLPGPHSAPAAAVQIVDFGPQNVTLGQSFNTQADGASALWFKTHNAKPGLVLVIGNDQLPTDFGSPELVSARVPQGKLNSPGWITLYLYDPQTGQRSNKVQLSVKP